MTLNGIVAFSKAWTAVASLLISSGVSQPDRIRVRRLAVHAGHRYGKLPAEAPPHARIQLQLSAQAEEHVEVSELAILCTLVRLRRPKTIFEFGTFDGRTIRNLSLNAPTDASITTIDIERKVYKNYPLDADGIKATESDDVANDLPSQGLPPNVETLIGDSRQMDFARFHGSQDFIFIDGGHEAEVVATDTRNALAMLRHPGLIVWHDYGSAVGPTIVIDRLVAAGDWPQFPATTRAYRIAGTTLAVLET
jgi:hypothetical protein